MSALQSEIPVVLTMAPRPGEQAVQERCCQSILDTGFKDLWIFAEPDTVVPECTWTKATSVYVRCRRFGEYHNWLAAVRCILNMRWSSPKILTCQDDILFIQNVSRHLRTLEWPSKKCGALHVYTSRAYQNYPIGKVTRLKMENHNGGMAAACAILFERQALKDVVEYADDNGWRGHTAQTITEPHLMEGLDTFLGEALTAKGWEIWLHNPSLAEHLSKDSTLGHGGPFGSRRAANFPGESADALALFPRAVSGT